MSDFDILHNGSMVGFTPKTEPAKDWVEENVQAESWQWLGQTLWIDHRFAADLVNGIMQAGLTVET